MASEDSKAVINYAGDEFLIGISPSGYALTLDTNHERNSAPTPMELLMIALGGCTAVDVISILRKKREHVSSYQVQVRGKRRDDHPRSFQQLQVHHIVRGDNVSEQAVIKAIELSETKYCSVAATLRPTAEIISSYEIVQEIAEGKGTSTT
jgi:putative redox protein